MRFIWPFVRRASFDVLVQQIQQVKLDLNVSEANLEHEKARGDDKRDRLIEARKIIDRLRKERDNWRKEGYK